MQNLPYYSILLHNHAAVLFSICFPAVYVPFDLYCLSQSPSVLYTFSRLRDRPATRRRAESLHARILIAGRQRSDPAFESEPFARRPR